MCDWKKKKLDLSFTILLGLVLAGTAVITFGEIGFVVMLFSGSLSHFPATLGIVALSSCAGLVLFPVYCLSSCERRGHRAIRFHHREPDSPGRSNMNRYGY